MPKVSLSLSGFLCLRPSFFVPMKTRALCLVNLIILSRPSLLVSKMSTNAAGYTGLKI